MSAEEVFEGANLENPHHLPRSKEVEDGNAKLAASPIPKLFHLFE
jgi:hypothetical protein